MQYAAALTYLSWPIWFAIWIAMSRGAKPAVRQESVAAQAMHVLPLVFSMLLIYSPLLGLPPSWQFLPPADSIRAAGAGLIVLGMGFTIWARRTLAGNWSGLVELKQDHELVRSGPYALARHPIYTGLLTALLGDVLALNAWPVAAAFVICIFSFLRKMRREEAFMRAQFGADYAAYKATTPSLIPGLKF